MTAPTTYVVPLTPPGRGAVAVVLVSGPDALAAVDAAFSAVNGRPLVDHPLGRTILGRWGRSLESPGEELVVCRRADDRVEVHPHGGVASVKSVVDRLTSAGCSALGWQEWITHDESDPIRAAARIALADALTERTAAILLDQYHGALRRALDGIKDLASGRCKPAGTLPRSPHNLPSHPSEPETPTANVDALLARVDLGLHLTQPWRVAVAGPPNVGKSSLVNAILGFTRTIVHDQPGTTRDIVTATTAIDGWPVEFLDTAGLHHGSDAVEAVGIEYARRQLADADLVVWVEDAADCRLSNRDEGESGSVGEGTNRWLRVSNKIDLMNARERSALATGDPQTVLTSAVTGDGIPELLASIVSHLVPDPPPPGAAVPFTGDQIAMLQSM